MNTFNDLILNVYLKLKINNTNLTHFDINQVNIFFIVKI